MLENFNNATTAISSRRTATASKAGNRVRPFINGQSIIVIAFVNQDTDVTTDGKTHTQEQEGFLCLDGRFLPLHFLFGARTIDESDLRYSPFEVATLPAEMRVALADANLGTTGAQVAKMWANLGIDKWDTDYGHPVPIKCRIGTARTGGTTGFSRWYWLQNATVLELPDKALELKEAKARFLARFECTLTNANALWTAIAADAQALEQWSKVLALPL